MNMERKLHDIFENDTASIPLIEAHNDAITQRGDAGALILPELKSLM